MFTDAEKEVTQNVILKREQTAQELASETQLTIAMNGSNGQLNTGKNLLSTHTQFIHSIIAC